VRECSLLLCNIVLQDTVHDTWRWLSDPIMGIQCGEPTALLLRRKKWRTCPLLTKFGISMSL
jgi:hypothetical protein